MTLSDAPDPRWMRRQRLAIGVAFIGTFLVFAPTFSSYDTAWSSEPYTHGYLLALGTVWLIWRNRGLFANPSAGWAHAGYVAAALSGIWLLATAGNISSVRQVVLPLLVLVWCASVLDRRAARRLAEITAVFLVAVPIWEGLIGPLQVLTVTACTALLSILRIPAEFVDNTIHLQYGSFVIEDNCAGFSFFMAGMAVGALYAQAFLVSWRARASVFAMAIVIAIIGNWIRVSSLIVLGHVSEMQASLIYNHGTYGWVIFVFGMLIFFYAAGRAVKRESARSAGAGASHHPPGDSKPDAPTGPRRSLIRPALASSAAVLVGPALAFTLPLLPDRAVQPSALSAPPAGWSVDRGPSERPYAWQPAFQGANVHRWAVWSRGAPEAGAPEVGALDSMTARIGDESVLVDRLEYTDQHQGSELVWYGNRIAADSLIVGQRRIGPMGPHGRVVNEAIVREGDRFLLVWYWYRVGGIETFSTSRAKLLEIPAFFLRKKLSELLAVSAACRAAEECQDAAQRLALLVAAT